MVYWNPSIYRREDLPVQHVLLRKWSDGLSAGHLLNSLVSLLKVNSYNHIPHHVPCSTGPCLPAKLRQLLRWQSSKFDGRMRCGTVLLDSLQSSELIFFTSYALSGLILPFSSFIFMLLETYGLQLHHLSSHSITLVVIFIDLCEMYVGVQPSVRLFWLFHVLYSSEKRVSPLSGYYFLHRTKGLAVYIATLSPDLWDHWRDDWVIMQADIHDRMELLTDAPTGSHNSWEKVPDLQRDYRPVLKRIQFLADKGLTSMMVLFHFLSKRITLL
jgi:hypothetical protein